MKAKNEKPVAPSFDELVFENRNKEYGAYTLRKKYNKSLLFSMIVGCLFISATVITPYAIYKPAPHILKKQIDSISVEFFNPNQLVAQKIEQPKPDVEKPPILDYNKIVVVDTLSPNEANQFLSQDDLRDSIQNENIENNVVDSPKPEIEKVVEDEIRDIVEEKPYFGTEGDKEFLKWIANNIIYPEEALEKGIQGRVYLKFVVEKNGKLSHLEVINKIDPILGKEAIRVLEMSPNWNPGKMNGTPVRVWFTFPITFSLKTN